MKKNNPLVSICCITYNHQHYVKTAIESILKQKTNFDYEIIIHDDASSDNTALIISEYQKKFPDRILFLKQSENKFSKEIHPMLAYVFPKTRGKYIAICEGDDFWTNENKLQTQIDFLEKNPEYTACSHQSYKLYPDNTKIIFSHITQRDFTTSELIGSRLFHTASFVFRSEIIKNNLIPIQTVSYDKILFILCSLFGKIRFMDNNMCIYRIHPNSVTQNWDIQLLLRDKSAINWLSSISKHFPKYRYKSNYYKSLFSYPKKLKKIKLVQYFLLYVYYSFSYFPSNLLSFIIFINKFSFRNNNIEKVHNNIYKSLGNK